MSEKKRICYIVALVLYVISIILAVVSFIVGGNADLALSIPALVIAIVGAVVHYIGTKERIAATENTEEQMAMDLNELNELVVEDIATESKSEADELEESE